MAVEMKEVGRKLYVFTRQDGQQNATACVIDAHGGLPVGSPQFVIPDGVTLYFYIKHGNTQSYNEDITNYEDESAKKYINFTYHDDVQGIMTGKFEAEEIRKGGDHCYDYLLMKLQASSNTGLRGKLSNIVGVRTALTYDDTKSMMTRWSGMDVVSVRNRWPTGQIFLSEAVKQLNQNGYAYANIHCSFCRWKETPKGYRDKKSQFPTKKTP